MNRKQTFLSLCPPRRATNYLANSHAAVPGLKRDEIALMLTTDASHEGDAADIAAAASLLAERGVSEDAIQSVRWKAFAQRLDRWRSSFDPCGIRGHLLKSSGHRITLYSYSEDGTVTVNVTGQYNALAFDRQVFGINPADLVECDLPPSDEPIGTMFTDPEDVDALLAVRIEALHRNGEKHNTARCRLCAPSHCETEVELGK